MTVAELIDLLNTFDPDRIVIMSKDGEGNSYSPLADFSEGAYLAESTWSGDVGLEKLTPELRKKGYSKEDLAVGGEPALVLWPVN